MSNDHKRSMRRPQFSLRAYRRDALGVLTGLRARQGDVAVVYLGGQRLIYISDAELITHAFRSDRADRIDQVRRWWLRSRRGFRPSGILFDTHDPLTHRNARAEFNEVFSNRRARKDAPEVANLMSAYITLQSERGPCDLETFVGTLLVAGLSLSLLGRQLTLDEASEWMSLYRKASPILSSPMFAPGLSADLLRRLTGITDLRHALPAFYALEREFADALSSPPPSTIGEAFRASGVAGRADLLTRMLMSPIQLAASMLPVWFALSDPPLLKELRGDPTQSDSQALLHGLVLEGARLVCPLTIGRVCLAPFAVGDVQLQRNDFLFASPFLVHRDERWWAEPESIQPRRWFEGTVESRPLGSFLTFGVPGPRMCPGRHQAISLLETALRVTIADWEVNFIDDITQVGWKPRVSNDDVEPDRAVSVLFARRRD